MITTAIKRILIVPDFGNAEAAERLLPLKEAIQEDSYYDAKIIDLRQIDDSRQQHSGRILYAACTA